MGTDLHKQIAAIMRKVQESDSNHQKFCINLTNLYKEVPTGLFQDVFERFVTVLLNVTQQKSNTYIDRAMNFLASVCASIGEAMYEHMYNHVLNLHNLHSDHIRYGVCQFVNKLGNSLVDVELSVRLTERIEDVMLERLMDGKASIRLQAVMALYRLQDPINKECPIIAAFLQHMQGDTAVKVRQICVEKIAVTKQVMQGLVTRTRDTKSEVRLAAFMRLTKFPKHLKISNRHEIIKNGFCDSSGKIRNYVGQKLIPEWLLEYGNDYAQFFKTLRMDSSEKDLDETNEVIRLALNALLKRGPGVVEDLVEMLKIGENRTIPLDELSIDSVIVWNHLSQYVRKSDQSDDLLYTILPDLVEFLHYIERYNEMKNENTFEKDFILKQLFVIAQGYDLSDTFTCNTLNNLIRRFLIEFDLDSGIIEAVIKNLEKSIPSLTHRILFISEAIDDIRYASVYSEVQAKEKDINDKVAEVEVTLTRLRQDQVLVIQEQDFITAAKNHQVILELEKIIADLKHSLGDKNDISLHSDPSTYTKCLKILRAVLRLPQTTALSPVLRTLMEEIIVVNITESDDNELRALALECYALCCLIDQNTADKGIQLFCVCLITNASADEVDLGVLLTAIKATADLLTFYGSDIMKNCVAGDFPQITISDIIQILADFLDHDEMEVEGVAVTALCNLLVMERIHSPSLISRMILKWCNPATDLLLKQQIGAMLEEFQMLQNAAHMLEKSMLLTVKTILQAPVSSPLSEVNVQDIMKFCITLCNVSEEDFRVNYNLAVNICCEIKDDPSSVNNVVLSKMLLLLEIGKIDKYMAEDLLHICEDIENEVTEVVQTNIVRFMSHLQKVRNSDDAITETCNDSIEV